MRTRIQLEKEPPQFEAVALRDWGRDAAPSVVNDEPEGAGADKSFPLEEARRLAQAILRLDGLTGAEIEAVTVYVTLRSSSAKPGQPPLYRFSFRSPMLAAFESKEMSAVPDKQMDKLARSTADWQNLHADIELGQ